MERNQPSDDQSPGRELPESVSNGALEASTDVTHAAESEEPMELPTLDDLQSQGFTPEQVRRLIVVSDRVADSPESRAAEADLRRLRFTRWLIEHGVLDEWTA